MTLKIRDLNESDLVQVAEIAKLSFAIPWSLKSFKEEFSNSKSILKVAEVNQEIVGYVVFRKIINEAELLSVAVKPAFRRRGIAKALIEKAMEEIKKYSDTCFLEVRASNTEAINLYEKLGFIKVGIRKNYYILPEEDAIIMRRDLKEKG